MFAPSATGGVSGLDRRCIDRQLSKGWSLPAELYTDPLASAAEDELIWRSAWQEVGVLSDFRNPGDYLTVKLGRYPIIVVKGGDGALNAYFNVCRHRGALLVGGPLGDNPDNLSGNCGSAFTCRFHGWSYDVSGALRGAPDRGLAQHDPNGLALLPVSVGTWGGIVFVSIEPTESLESFMADVATVAHEEGYTFPFASEELELAGVYEWDVQCNWKTFMEINLECYHCRTTHRDSLSAVLKVDRNFEHRLFKNGNHLKAPFTDSLDRRIGSQAASKLRQVANDSGEGAFQQFWIFPNNMWTTGVGFGNSLFRIDPTGPTTCRMIARVYLHPGDLDERSRLDAFVKDVIEEDVGACNGVQLGLASGAWSGGPVIDEREGSVRWFQAQVWDRLAPRLSDRPTVVA